MCPRRGKIKKVFGKTCLWPLGTIEIKKQKINSGTGDINGFSPNTFWQMCGQCVKKDKNGSYYNPFFPFPLQNLSRVLAIPFSLSSVSAKRRKKKNKERKG